MKKILIAILLTGFIVACKKDVSLKPSQPAAPDYTLPQGKSPADNRIVELFKKYNTYFLYDYTVADFNWNQIRSREGAYSSTNGDPQYVGDMLDLLQDKWFRFYPEAFLKQQMPYKVFLADSLYTEFFGNKFLEFVGPGAENLALGYVNEQLKGRDNTFKNIYKIRINAAFWDLLIDKKTIDLPATFFTQSNYKINTSSDPTSFDYFKTRGFTENYSSLQYYTVEENQNRDIKSFIRTMISLKKSEWDTQFLVYPAVKKKYDILQAHMRAKYNIDLQLIGDTE